jgi:hypothetical protein
MRRFFTAGALMTAVALAAVTAASAAVPSPSYTLGGFALGTSYFGTGIGSTGDRGNWQATLRPDGSGTFSLRSNGQTLAGTLSGGLPAVQSAAPGCGRQVLSVTEAVATAGGPMTLTATITQVRFQFRGTCFVLLSTVQGTLAPAAATPDPGPVDSGGGQL